MNLISQYVLRVGAYVIFSMLMEAVIPAGSSKKIVKLMIGLVFMYVLIQPIIGWLQQEIPLEQLTMTDLVWDEETNGNTTADYEKQAMIMVEKGYESVLIEQGLPRELKDQYEIVEIEMGDPIEVVLTRNNEIGGITDYTLDLGQIGSGDVEEDSILKSLSSHWGVPQDNLEMRLR